MGVVTLRPNINYQYGANEVIVGGVDNYAVLNDNTDISYIALRTGTDGPTTSIEVGFDNLPALPVGSAISRIRMRARIQNDTGVTAGDGSYLYGMFSLFGRFNVAPGFSGAGVFVGGAESDVNGAWLSTKTDGTYWTVANINDIRGSLVLVTPSYLGTEQGFIAELFIDIEYNELPTCVATGPAGTLGIGSPAVTWTYADAEGDHQTVAHVGIFTAAQYGVGGFDPLTSPHTYYADISGTALSVIPSITLPNGVYRAYVAVEQAAVSGITMRSAWSHVDFIVDSLPAARPTISRLPYADLELITELDIRGGENLFWDDDASFDASLGHWVGYNGITTLTRTVAAGEFASGIAATKMVSTAGGNVGGFTSTGATLPVVPGELYRAHVKVKSGNAGVSHDCFVSITWKTPANTVIRSDLDIVPAHATDAGFLEHFGTYWPAPSNAAFVDILVFWTAAGAGEIVFLDEAGIHPAQVQNLFYIRNDSFFDTAVEHWINGPNTVVSWTNTAGEVFDIGAMKLTAVAAGAVTAETYNGAYGLIPVVPGRDYRVRMVARAKTAGRTTQIGADWVGADGALVSTDAPVSLGIDFTVGFSYYDRVVTAPANARYIRPIVSFLGCGAGESHMVADIVVFEDIAFAPQWGRGGLINTAGGPATPPRYEVEYHDLNGVHSDWTPLPWTDPSRGNPHDLGMDSKQNATLVDLDVEPRNPRIYRARMVAQVPGGIQYSDWSLDCESDQDTLHAWLKDPTDEAMLQVTHIPPFDKAPIEPQTMLYPLGRDLGVSITEGVKGWTLHVNLRVLDKPNHDALVSMLTRARPLIFINAMGEKWWVKFNDTSANLLHAQPVQGEVTGSRFAYEFALTATEVDTPDLGA